MESAKVDITRTALSLNPLKAPCVASGVLVRLLSSSATLWTAVWAAARADPPANGVSTAASAAVLDRIHASRMIAPSCGDRKLIIRQAHRNSRKGAELCLLSLVGALVSTAERGHNSAPGAYVLLSQ